MGISETELFALKGCHEAGTTCVRPRKKSSCLHGIRCLAKTRNLNSRGHSVMKLSVGGTQSLNATCKLLIAEKTFYIFVNEKNF